ncbi:unnamed protein product [Tetraodon nigroviridis]|uniref:(spotted green pufferfish) hypothetical protein n=1 Tax=Tetraodon nigroviridis TaxID=99883 RepID=Q4SFB3_TETNG|nr:unnamed protein product [Tetraodon nigroviridis]
MASPQQSRIQSYLERNQIGPLFQELMTKLITETPDHPIPFLIDHLQTKQDSPSKLQRALSGSAALWAQSSPESKNPRREHRDYEKPWQIHPKKPKKSKSDLAVSSISPPSPESKSVPRSAGYPSWDWRESRDFDELNHILQESKKLGKALESLSRSIAVSDELDQVDKRGYNPVLRPRVVGRWVGREDEDADPLAAEMLQPPVPRARMEVCWRGDNSPAGSLKLETRSRGLRDQQQQHKKLLAAMLSQDSFDSVHSPEMVTEDEMEDEDDAMELLEDLDDLRMEGVTGLAPSGCKFSQGRSSYQPEPQAKVTLNICSRCARGKKQKRIFSSEGDWIFVIGVHIVMGHFCHNLAGFEVEKDLAKLAEVGKLTTRSSGNPDSSLLHSPLRHRALPDTLPLTSLLSRPQSPGSSLSGKPCGVGLPLLSPKSSSLFMGRTKSPSNPGSRTQTPRTPSRPLTPNSLLTRSTFNPGSHKEVTFRRSRSRPVTPTSQPIHPRPLLTPPGLSTMDSLGASLRAYLSEVRP